VPIDKLLAFIEKQFNAATKTGVSVRGNFLRLLPRPTSSFALEVFKNIIRKKGFFNMLMRLSGGMNYY